VNDLLDVFACFGGGAEHRSTWLAEAAPAYPGALARTTDFMTHPRSFKRYHSETELLRYITACSPATSR
jgi:hypothetical protein